LRGFEDSGEDKNSIAERKHMARAATAGDGTVTGHNIVTQSVRQEQQQHVAEHCNAQHRNAEAYSRVSNSN
jgi:hypothetical protein